jgi:hypothetical protein
LISTDPTATPTEKMARKSVATCSLACSTFLTRGGNWAARIAPIIQKKLIEAIARNSRGMCRVALTRVIEARMMCQSIRATGASASGGAGGTIAPMIRPTTATSSTPAAA